MNSQCQRPPFSRAVTSKGQLTVPTTLVRATGWQPGDTLAVTALEDDPLSFLVKRVDQVRLQRDGRQEAA
jgi:bifunctional DNA-binding transcriptional regulator/antitoxin component of YhaV-PrlF toxin-antitoxin module